MILRRTHHAIQIRIRLLSPVFGAGIVTGRLSLLAAANVSQTAKETGLYPADCPHIIERRNGRREYRDRPRPVDRIPTAGTAG